MSRAPGIGAWEKKTPSITIGIPHQGTVTMEWAANFKAIKIPGGADNAYYFYTRGGPIDRARNDCVESMLQNGSEWLFFLDSDIVMPPTGIERLMGYGLPVVSGLYYVREPHQGMLCPAMWRQNPDKQGYTPITEFGFGTLVDADAVGSGCLLVHRSVFEKLKPPWFSWTNDLKGSGLGEDFYFCDRVRTELGWKVMVDPTVLCDHLNLTKVVHPGTIAFCKV